MHEPRPASRLSVSTREPAPGIAVVECAGEIDMADAPTLVAAVPDDSHVVVDLAGVTYFGSAGVRALLDVRAIAGRGGRGLSLTGVRGNRIVSDVLRIVGATDLFEVHDDQAAAVAGFISNGSRGTPGQ
jgi:anti-sigma B factor antagonist